MNIILLVCPCLSVCTCTYFHLLGVRRRFCCCPSYCLQHTIFICVQIKCNEWILYSFRMRWWCWLRAIYFGQSPMSMVLCVLQATFYGRLGICCFSIQSTINQDAKDRERVRVKENEWFIWIMLPWSTYKLMKFRSMAAARRHEKYKNTE